MFHSATTSGVSLSRALWIASIVLSVSRSAPADLIVLHTGQRIECDVVSETDDDVSFMRRFKSGDIRYEQTLRRSLIARIERSPALPDTQPALDEPQTRPAVRQPDEPTISSDERRVLFDTALTNWNEKKHAAAGLNLSRVIHRAPAPELAVLSADAKHRTSLSLAELAAEAHLRAAHEAAPGKPIRLSYVTLYEIPALVPRLTAAYKAALDSPVAAAAPSATRPAEAEDDASRLPKASAPRTTTITEWLDRPASYDGDSAEADALLDHLDYTLSLLSERTRFDPAVRRDMTLKRQLHQERRRLLALIDSATARAAGAMTPEEAAARREENRRLFEDLARQQQEAHDAHRRRALKLAEQQQKQEALSD